MLPDALLLSIRSLAASPYEEALISSLSLRSAVLSSVFSKIAITRSPSINLNLFDSAVRGVLCGLVSITDPLRAASAIFSR